MGCRILFSNIGYARGIDGTLWQHVCRFNRHFYCPAPLQMEVLAQLKNIISLKKPDVCCFVEIDEGSVHSAGFNQVAHMLDSEYSHFDSADKYGPDSWLGRMPLHAGKCSAFMAKEKLEFERLYFKNGSKRLIHQVELPGGVSLYFTHFSLHRRIRERQFAEMRGIVDAETGPVIIMGDFNIMRGFSELRPLLEGTDLRVLNRETDPTFMLHRRFHTLDLCICSESLADRMTLEIIPQPFSDHAALLAEGAW